MAMSHGMKTTTLEGQTFTTDDVISKVGCARSTATKRIKNCKTIAELFGPVMLNKIRKFTIEDVTFTVNEISKRLDCSSGTAYHRLMNCQTLNELFRDVGGSIDERNTHNEKMTDMDDEINRLLFGKW